MKKSLKSGLLVLLDLMMSGGCALVLVVAVLVVVLVVLLCIGCVARVVAGPRSGGCADRLIRSDDCL